MALPTTITIAQQANLIKAELQAWAEPREGTAHIIANVAHLWEVVGYPSPTMERPRLVVCFMGETARGGFDRSNKMHRVDRKWKVVFVRGHGFKSMLAESDFRQPEKFYDAVESVRLLLRCMDTIDMEPPITYVGITPRPNIVPQGIANVFIDGFDLDFSTANDIIGIDVGNA